ncbi:efflux RND transporter permease subunit, partial [Geobacillus sp. MMMUD3]|nr:efflux RND transporter permease subunit [Geobacillus sp. MMMUD3]
PVISFSTKHPVLMIVAALIILAGTGAMVPQLKTELFGDTGQEQLQVTQTFDPGTDLDEASEQSQQVEDILVADDSIESYQVSIGGSTFGFADDSGLSGTFIVNSKPGTSAQSISAELQRKFDALEGVGQVELQDQSSTPGAQTIDVTLTSSDTAVLEDTTEKVAQRLEDVPGAQSVTSDVEAVQPVIEVKVDQEKAAEENLTEAAIGQYVQRAMRGQSI